MSDSTRATVTKAVLEVVLIGIGVFLGMAADQWRSDRQHRDQARDSLQRFRAEIQANQAAVDRVKDYHVAIQKAIGAYLDPKTRPTTDLEMVKGFLPAVFEHTAWDLALATQSLADIDPGLAFELARLYGSQQTYEGLTGSLATAMYQRPPSEDLPRFLHSLKLWLDEIVIREPAMAENYKRILPMIDRALKD